MSVSFHEEAEGKIVVVKLSGKLTKEDYAHFVPTVERRIAQHGKVRMLVEMHDFHGWQLGALWEDLKFDIHHFAHLERVAIVGESAWEHGMTVFCKPFTKASLRYFDRSKQADALEWVREGLPTTVQASPPPA